MHTATGGGSVAQQIALVHELGFDGVAWGMAELDAARHACEAVGGDLLSAYVVLDLAADQQADQLRQAFAAIDSLAGGPGMLWLALQHGQMAPRDAAGDAAADQILSKLLAHANRCGVEIALYPHAGYWLETCDDAMRLCQRNQ